MGSSGRPDLPGAERGRFTTQVDRRLSQLEATATKASDQTLISAVITGRKALAEWQHLASLLGDLEGEYERLALSESRARVRLLGVLELLDKLAEPPRSASPPERSGQSLPGGLIPPPRPSGDNSGCTAPGVLAARMLGAFELTIDGRRVTDWHGQRSQLLMHFLTAHRQRSVSRDELIAAIWPDADDDSGRHRLHQAVYELRRTVRAIEPDRAPVLCVDGTYRLNPEVPVWVDVDEFDDLTSSASRCLATGKSGHAIELGQQALKLYRGDFLCQFTGADWTTAERNRLRARFVQLSIHLGELLATHGDHAAALAIVDPVLSMEPWNEDATVITMLCHARSGARSMAGAAYRSCARALTCEFGMTPAAQTVRVYDQIRAAGPDGLTGARGRTGSRPPSPPSSGAARPSR